MAICSTKSVNCISAETTQTVLALKVEAGTFKIKGYEGPVLECDKCGSEMQLKNGRFGKYFGCMSDDCKNTRKLLRSGEAAPPKMDPVPMPELKCYEGRRLLHTKRRRVRTVSGR